HNVFADAQMSGYGTAPRTPLEATVAWGRRLEPWLVEAARKQDSARRGSVREHPLERLAGHRLDQVVVEPGVPRERPVLVAPVARQRHEDEPRAPADAQLARD